jgi:hypothetical protein
VAEKAGPDGECRAMVSKAFLLARFTLSSPPDLLCPKVDHRIADNPAYFMWPPSLSFSYHSQIVGIESSQAAVISDPDDPKFDLEKLMEAYDKGT